MSSPLFLVSPWDAAHLINCKNDHDQDDLTISVLASSSLSYSQSEYIQLDNLMLLCNVFM